MKSALNTAGRVTGKAVDVISTAFGIAGGTLFALCGLIVTYDVIRRYVFQAPSIWVFEISTLLTLVAVFFTVSYGLKEDSHISVQVLTRLLPDRARSILEIISYIFIIGYASISARYSFIMVVKSYSLSERSDLLGLQVWPVKTAFFAAFVVLLLQAFRMLISKCYSIMNKQSEPSGMVFSMLIVLIFVTAFGTGAVTCLTLSPAFGLVALLLLLLAFGVPVSFTLGIVSTIGFISVMDVTRGLSGIPQFSYWVWNGFTVMALPLFIFVGHIMYRSGLADELFFFARLWLGHLPGGLAVAALAACAIFAAISGSSVVNAATIGLVAIPAMMAYQYEKRMATGVVAAGGTLGILIPPSTAMILIGITADESIGHLFMAGMIPGILLFVFLSIAAIIMCKISGAYQPLPKVSWRERLIGTKTAMGALLMPVIILGGIYTGVFTPTEAAAIAVTYALVFALFIKRIRWIQLLEIIKESTKTLAMAAILLAGGIALGKVVTMLQIAQNLTTYLANAGWPGWFVILVTMGLIIVLGMFLDGSAIVLLTMPILAPLIRSQGFDMLWFAVLVTMNTEIGLITPPIGMNVFIIQQVSGIDFDEVLRGAAPFLIVLTLALIVVALFPALSLWLPGTMK